MRIRIPLIQFLINFQLIKKSNYNFFFFLYFNFISYFTPHNLSNIRFFYNNFNKKKLYLKQSYIYLIWFYYLNQIKSSKNIKLIFLPSKFRFISNIKAPIAHKTKSKEQFFFQYFKFKYKLKLKLHYILNFNQLIFLLFFIKNKFPIFETNLFIIKNFLYLIYFKSYLTFNYYKINNFNN